MNIGNQQRPDSDNFSQFKGGPSNFPGAPTGPGPAARPPPIPSRTPRHNIQSYQPYPALGYGSVGGYGYGNNWNYRGGGYNSYMPYNTGYNSVFPSQLGGPSGDIEQRFIQFAEESGRPAFQSVESIVRTFSSIAMMLESTLFAMTSSFRAVLNVAENIGKTRNMFGELMSAFALVRFLKFLYRKITYTLGISPEDPNAEKVWRKTAGEPTNSNALPVLMFLSLTIGISCIINKLLNSAKENKVIDDDPKAWFRSNEPIYSAVVQYKFDALSPEELSVTSGQKVWLAPESLQRKDLPGWTKVSDNRGGVGRIPSDYMRIVGQLKKKSDENVNSEEWTKIADEIPSET